VTAPRPRPAVPGDLPGITRVIDHYIATSPANFKTLPLTPGEAQAWFAQFGADGRFRLLVADAPGGGGDWPLSGFACSQPHPVRRAAYDTSVMATVYLAPTATGRGLGTALYTALFAALAGQDIHRVIAGITLPNDASVALHEKFGFERVGVFTETGRKFGRYWDVLWMERPLALAPGGGA
jgi:phosphinothricin acetyltransferase